MIVFINKISLLRFKKNELTEDKKLRIMTILWTEKDWRGTRRIKEKLKSLTIKFMQKNCNMHGIAI